MLGCRIALCCLVEAEEPLLQSTPPCAHSVEVPLPMSCNSFPDLGHFLYVSVVCPGEPIPSCAWHHGQHSS